MTATQNKCLEGSECKETCEEWEEEFDVIHIQDVCCGCSEGDIGGLYPDAHSGIKDFIRNLLAAERTKAKEEGRQEERERINEYFGTKADCNTDTDEVIISDKVYHDAFNPNGCTKGYCEYCKHY